MRYFLALVAICAFLSVCWAGALTIQANARTGWAYGGGVASLVLLATVGLVLAFSAVGLIKRRPWGAYLLAILAFGSLLPILVLMLLAAMPTPGYTSDRSDPAELILLGALFFAPTVGGISIGLGRSMGRESATNQGQPRS